MTRLALLLAAALALGAAAPALAQTGRSQAVLPGGNAREPVNIEANKLEWFDKDQRAVYSGDVVVMQGESSMRATVLTIFLTKADGAEEKPAAGASGAALGPSGGSQISRMEASGPVTVIQKDSIGTGDRGEYERAANRVTLIGNVTLAQGGNVTVGDRLVYDLNSKQAVVHSGASKGRVQGVFTPGAGGKK